MSQLNLDKLNLFLPPSAATGSGRSPRAESPGAFDEHLQRASNSGAAGPAAERRASESPAERPAPAQPDHRDPAERNEAPPPAESKPDHGDDQPGRDPSQTAKESQPAAANKPGDETNADRPEDETDAEDAGIEAGLVAEIAAAALGEDPAASRHDPSVEATQASSQQLAADADGETTKTHRAVKKPAKEPLAAQSPGELGATLPAEQQEGAVAAGDHVAVDENAGPTDARQAAEEPSRAARNDRASARRAAAEASEAEAIGGDPDAEPAAGSAAAAETDGLGAAARRLAEGEPGAASRPNFLPVDGLQAAADAANESETVKPAAAVAGRNAAATESRGQNPHAAPSDQVDRVRFVQRVAGALEAAQSRGGQMRLRLHPPELGALRLDITLRNGVMHARLEVETAAARNLLLDNLPALRERLAELDVKIQQFDVELDMRSSGGPPQGPGDQQHGYEQSQRGESPRGRAAETLAEPAALPALGPSPSGASQFDVTI